MRTQWNFFIPARAGSKGVKGKNYQQVGGLPLICHSIDLIAGLPDDLVRSITVSTDDPVIRGIVEARYGSTVELQDRPPHLATDDATIDDFCAWLDGLPDVHPFCVFQPTTFGVDPDDLEAKLRHISKLTDLYTAVTPRRKLDWFRGREWYPPIRANRQNLDANVYTEVGVRFHPAAGANFDGDYELWDDYEPITLAGDIIDIDTPEDLERVRHRVEPLTITFYPIANEKLGLGHLKRCIALAERLQHHNVQFSWELAEGYQSHAPEFPAVTYPADVAVLDRLDTTRADIMELYLRGVRNIVTFEDRGDGAVMAQAVISDMYPSGRATLTEYVGPEYVVLRPEFLAAPRFAPHPTVSRVLVTFGGTDPGRFTERFAPFLAGDWEVRVVAPPGRRVDADEMRAAAGFTWLNHPSMAAEMAAADIVVTSAGRTLYEAAACGTPAIAISQNQREAKHLHLGHGNMYLGDGRDLTGGDVLAAVHRLAASPDRRQEMFEEAVRLVDKRGTDRVARIIEETGRL